MLTRDEYIDSWLTDPSRLAKSRQPGMVSKRTGSAKDAWYGITSISKQYGSNFMERPLETATGVAENHQYSYETRRKYLLAFMHYIKVDKYHEYEDQEHVLERIAYLYRELSKLLKQKQKFPEHLKESSRIASDDDDSSEEAEEQEEENFETEEMDQAAREFACMDDRTAANFIADWPAFKTVCTVDYQAASATSLKKLDSTSLSSLELKMNRLIAVLFSEPPRRLDYMYILAKQPTKAQKEQWDMQKRNYIFKGKKQYYIKVNYFKTVHDNPCVGFKPYIHKLSKLAENLYLELYPTAIKHGCEYLFHLPTITQEPNHSARLQEAFNQILGLPLSAIVLRKMYLYYVRQTPADKLDKSQLSDTMKANYTILVNRYDLRLPVNYISPVLNINRPLQNRTGPKPRRDHEKKALLAVKGKYWGRPHRANAIKELRTSKDIIRIPGYQDDTLENILKDMNYNSIGAMIQQLTTRGP